MLRLLATVLLLSTPVAAIAAAPAPIPVTTDRVADEAAIKALGIAWQDAWNKRDAAGLAAIMDPQVTFVSVLGPDTPGHGRRGRDSFRNSHAAMLEGPMFSNSTWTTKDVTIVRWLTPDIAIAHVVWDTTGDNVRHLPPGTPRRGMFTWVVQRQDGQWRVVASQNTEAMPPWTGGSPSSAPRPPER